MLSHGNSPLRSYAAARGAHLVPRQGLDAVQQLPLLRERGGSASRRSNSGGIIWTPALAGMPAGRRRSASLQPHPSLNFAGRFSMKRVMPSTASSSGRRGSRDRPRSSARHAAVGRGRGGSPSRAQAQHRQAELGHLAAKIWPASTRSPSITRLTRPMRSARQPRPCVRSGSIRWRAPRRPGAAAAASRRSRE